MVRGLLDPETEMLVRLDMLERIKRERDKTVADALKKQEIVALAATSPLPIVLTDGSIEIRNKAARPDVKTRIIDEGVLKEKQLAVSRSGAPAWVKRFWNALEIKPGAFGVKLDLKKAMGWEEWK